MQGENSKKEHKIELWGGITPGTDTNVLLGTMIRIGKPNKMQKTEPEFIKNYKSYLRKTRYAQNKNEGTKNIAKKQ